MKISAVALGLLMVVPLVTLRGISALGGGDSPDSISSPAFINYPGPATTDSSGEPTLGVNWNTGKVMMMTGGFPLLNIPPSQHVSRISFDDSVSPAAATWDDATPSFLSTNLDPILNVDATSGRTFAGGDDGACTLLAWTDDDGAHWTPAGNSCPVAVDHPTVGQGVSSPSAPLQPNAALYPAQHVVYVCQQESVDACAVSLDGGISFLPSVPLVCGFVNPGLFGHLRVGPDGTAYVPFNACASTGQGVSVSTTDGEPSTSSLPTSVGGWVGKPIAGLTAGASGQSNDPSVAVGRGDTVPGGRVYFAANKGTDHHAVVTTSTNHGTTWTVPVDLNVASTSNSGDAVGVKNIAFPAVIAGDDNRAAVAFLGTKDGTGNADPYANAGFTGVWHLYVAFTYDGGATWQSVDATPSDPVQRGMICLQGTTCPSNRNLLDFMDITVDANGRVLVGYADGCLPGCSTPAASQNSLATIARQTCGGSLFAADGNVEGTGTCPTGSPAPPSNTLSGTLYMTGPSPVGNADGLIAPGDTLTTTAPTGPVPKVASNALVLGGSNAGSLYDDHWFKDGAATINGTVTVNFYASAVNAGTVNLRVAIFDAGSGSFVATTPSLVEQTISVGLTPTPTPFSVSFPSVSANLGHGFEVFFSQSGTGELDLWYDSTSTPSNVVFS